MRFARGDGYFDRRLNKMSGYVPPIFLHRAR